MAVSRLPITKSHFLRKLHKRQIKHLEWQREGFQQQFDEFERQVAPRREVSDEQAIEQTIGEVNIEVGHPLSGQNMIEHFRKMLLPKPQASWRWLTIPLLTLLLSSSMLAPHGALQDIQIRSAQKQAVALATIEEVEKVREKFLNFEALFSILGRLSARSKALSSRYDSQAFSGSVEQEDMRAFLKTEVKINWWSKGEVKEGVTARFHIMSSQSSADGLVFGYVESPLPDGLWLKLEAPVDQGAREAVVEEGVSEEVREESAPQHSYVSPITNTFRWPATGPITQGAHRYHMALDIAAPFGTPILASDGGEVIQAGWNNYGYGNLVVIDHQNGYTTYYAHLSQFAVQVGSIVHQGSLIGKVGSTGNSTGPHLHFEIRLRNVLQNPWGYLY